MTRRLLYLSGLAILGTVLYHSVGWAFVGMFWWTDRYAPVSVPDFSQIGSAAYYGLRTIEQVIIPGVPSFLFVAGFFAAFASGKSHGRHGWGWIIPRLTTLLVPYLIWSFANLAGGYALGDRRSLSEVLRLLLVGGASAGYYFIPLLCQLYLLSPVLVPLARRQWPWLLIGSAAVQIAAQLGRYAAHLNWPVPPLLDVLAPAWFFPGNLLWFSAGLTLGFHAGRLLEGIVRGRWIWLAGWLLLLVPGILEWEWVLRMSGQTWLGSAETLLDNLYTALFLLTFLGFHRAALPWTSRIGALGGKAFGIYLMNGLVLTFLAKLVYNLAPQLLAIPLLFVLVLAVAGVGVPLALMETVRRTPLRRAYSVLFG